MLHIYLYFIQLFINVELYKWILHHTSYEEARAKGVDNYDVELENVIDKLIVECDKKIGRALKRLEDDDAKAAIAISVTEVTQVTRSSITTFILSISLFCYFIFEII